MNKIRLLLLIQCACIRFSSAAGAADDGGSGSGGGAGGSSKANCKPGPHAVTNPYPDPDPRAPDRFRVQWWTTASRETPIVLEVFRRWSPLGVDRFHSLVRDNFYDCAAFFRVVPDFVVQFGIASDPNETSKWSSSTIPDDPVVESNTFGFVSFATSGPNTRTTQIFINLANNSRLDAEGFSPFARVASGMDVALSLANPTPGDPDGVDQDNYTEMGNPWILEYYPDVDLIEGDGRAAMSVQEG